MPTVWEVTGFVSADSSAGDETWYYVTESPSAVPNTQRPIDWKREWLSIDQIRRVEDVDLPWRQDMTLIAGDSQQGVIDAVINHAIAVLENSGIKADLIRRKCRRYLHEPRTTNLQARRLQTGGALTKTEGSKGAKSK
jgi:hypothetical protein